MNFNTSGNLLSFEEVSAAEAKPGLYAWYLRIIPGKSNIKSSEDFTKALKRINQQLCHPTLTTQLRGHFNMKLKGHLKHIWYGHDEKPFTKKFQEVLKHPEERKVLSNILESAVPLFTGPLYIGVSKNLQQRLKGHTQLIQKYHKEHEENTEHQEDTTLELSADSRLSLQNDKNFARRIVERQIDPNHLAVSITYVPAPQLPEDRIRKTIEAAETLLNRMFYPILGRK